MTFQYFFFSTYPGYFLQVLPLAVLAAVVCYRLRRRRHPELSRRQAVGASLFVAYLTALLTLTLLVLWLGELYHLLFYHMPSSRDHFGWSRYSYDFVPHFWKHFGREQFGNILLFLPFGFLFPLFRRNSGPIRTLLSGVAVSLIIEVVQPVIGRSCDINDLILNSIGVLISTLLFYLFRFLFRKRRTTVDET